MDSLAVLADDHDEMVFEYNFCSNIGGNVGNFSVFAVVVVRFNNPLGKEGVCSFQFCVRTDTKDDDNFNDDDDECAIPNWWGGGEGGEREE